MTTRQEVLTLVDQLPENKLPELFDFLQKLLFPPRQTQELDDEQKALLNLLSYTVDTSIPDLAQNQDHYLYGTAPNI